MSDKQSKSTNENDLNFVQMLQKSGWKTTKNKSGKKRLQKDIEGFRIILFGDDISTLIPNPKVSVQSRTYSSKFTEFIANIICERTEAIDATVFVLSKATEGKKSKVLKRFNNIPVWLNSTGKQLDDQILRLLKAEQLLNKNTVGTNAEEKNQAKPLSKDQMIDSILDRLTDEQFDFLAKYYKILNMD